MRILLTGASSMTGMWFAQELATAGHEVLATFTRESADAYGDDLRGRRVGRVLAHVEPLFGLRFGDADFVRTIGERSVDCVCHHGADVTDYKSPDFDVAGAVANNTAGLVGVLRALRDDAGGRLALTGSVFEEGEGAGSEGLPNVSPYGMSKAIASQMFRFYAAREGVRLGKFVIPNPFGPFEEPRFTNYLMKTWRSGDVAGVRTPRYVRDNVHASLLAAAYRRFVETLDAAPGYTPTNPSGYVESQGAFAERFATAMRERTGMACELDLAEQTEFAEPRVRINTDPIDAADLGWDEAGAWDAVAEFYEQQAPLASA